MSDIIQSDANADDKPEQSPYQFGTWYPIETAPKDFTPIFAIAIGADNRPMRAIIRWACLTHIHSSRMECGMRQNNAKPDCRFEWISECGESLIRYGVDFTHWMPLPPSPSQGDRTDEDADKDRA